MMKNHETLQDLKLIHAVQGRFGQGFTVTARLKREEIGEEPDTSVLKTFITRNFEDVELKQDYNGEVTYQVLPPLLVW